MAKKQSAGKTVETLKHEGATRKNIPTAEYQPMLQKNEQDPILVAYERRNKDLDPQLVWRGKDMKDWSDLVVHAPPIYIQEKVHPKALIDDLLRLSKQQDYESGKIMADLFSDFNGIPKDVNKTEFYQHDQNWSNRMILGESLQVMASLAEREGLKAQVQCIYFDPPYGIKFNSNFQWSTTNRDVKDGRLDNITREPEQVKAFRDTWRDGIHSYLTYIRDRLTVARDLLTDTGSIFVQIGDENVHRVRSVIDEVFGEDNFITQFLFKKTGSMSGNYISGIADTILWFGKDKTKTKFRRLVIPRSEEAVDSGFGNIELPDGTIKRISGDDDALLEGRRFQTAPMMSSGEAKEPQPFILNGLTYFPAKGNHWKVNNLSRLNMAGRLLPVGKTLTFKKYLDESKYTPLTNIWMDTMESTFAVQRVYIVQTSTKVVQRCILMSTDPGDIVLDPTCGSGTSAVVAEQWGRRWITIDTSRVALVLARARMMSAKFPFYLLADSKEGQIKEAELRKSAPSTQPTKGNIRQGFVYERTANISPGSVANNSEVDVIWNKWHLKLDPLREQLNKILKKKWNEWEIPNKYDDTWPKGAKDLHSQWCDTIEARQREMDISISAKSDFEYIYDSPYDEKKKVRVAGPFTIESLSPHRSLGVDENDELIDPLKQSRKRNDDHISFTQMIIDNLGIAGVQQSKKEDKIDFKSSLVPWPGDLICAEGRYMEGDVEKRAAIFIGPEFGTVQRIDLVTAAREAGDAGFDVLISCAFNYEAHTTEFNKLGRIPVLKARMNADLHMSDDLKNTGKGNLFVIFGEPDIEWKPAKNNNNDIQVTIKGVYVFDPTTGEVRSDDPDGIACWFIDTDYNEESFFVRHAYFLGANDPYSALKTSLRAEINKEAWESLHSDISRPFPKPKSGRIAVKAINHLGDEVMKVFKID